MLSRKQKVKNLGVFARIEKSYPALKSLSVPLADGLIANVGTNFNPITTGGGDVLEYFNSNQPGAFAFAQGVFIPGLNGKNVKITCGVQLSTNRNCNITPLLGDGYGTIYQGANGAPKLITSYGYGGGVDVLQNKIIWIEREFIYKGFIENLGSFGLYRNLDIADNATSRTIAIRKYFIDIRQIEV